MIHGQKKHQIKVLSLYATKACEGKKV